MVGQQLVFRRETWVCNDYNATSILKIARNGQRQMTAFYFEGRTSSKTAGLVGLLTMLNLLASGDRFDAQ